MVCCAVVFEAVGQHLPEHGKPGDLHATTLSLL